MEILLRTLLVGTVTGSVYALSSIGLVLTYRTSGVLNLGYGAIAMFTTFLHWTLIVRAGVPQWISAILVIGVIAPLIGIALEAWIFGRLRDQPVVIGVIATVGVWVLLQGIVYLAWGSETRTVPSLFSQATVPLLGGARVGIDQLAVLAVAVGSAAALAAGLRFTRAGIAFRAVVDDRALAGLMRVRSTSVSRAAWAIGTAFAAMTGILLTPRLLLDPTVLPAFIIAFVIGSAMAGHLRSLPLAYAGGLLLGLVQALIVQYGTGVGLSRQVGSAAPFALTAIFALIAPRADRLTTRGTALLVRAKRHVMPPALTRAAGPAAVLILVAVPAMAAGSISWRLAVTSGMIFSIVFLSFVVLTGLSGQISFGQTAFMGIAAFSAAHLAAARVPALVALLLGALAAVPAGALIGFVAARLHGLYLALTTLAFAFLCQELIFSRPSISGAEGRILLPRPAGLTGDTAFYYLVLAILAAFLLLTAALRSGKTGRVLAAIRDSETGAASIGMNVGRRKIIVFALSAFMAGTGAVLAGMSSGQVARLDFIPFLSLVYMTIAVVGGVFQAGGAITAGMLYGIYPQMFRNTEIMLKIELIVFGLAATVALAKNPEGLYGQVRTAAAAIVGRFAERTDEQAEQIAEASS